MESSANIQSDEVKSFDKIAFCVDRIIPFFMDKIVTLEGKIKTKKEEKKNQKKAKENEIKNAEKNKKSILKNELLALKAKFKNELKTLDKELAAAKKVKNDLKKLIGEYKEAANDVYKENNAKVTYRNLFRLLINLISIDYVGGLHGYDFSLDIMVELRRFHHWLTISDEILDKIAAKLKSHFPEDGSSFCDVKLSLEDGEYLKGIFQIALILYKIVTEKYTPSMLRYSIIGLLASYESGGFIDSRVCLQEIEKKIARCKEAIKKVNEQIANKIETDRQNTEDKFQEDDVKGLMNHLTVILVRLETIKESIDEFNFNKPSTYSNVKHKEKTSPKGSKTSIWQQSSVQFPSPSLIKRQKVKPENNISAFKASAIVAMSAYELLRYEEKKFNLIFTPAETKELKLVLNNIIAIMVIKMQYNLSNSKTLKGKFDENKLLHQLAHNIIEDMGEEGFLILSQTYYVSGDRKVVFKKLMELLKTTPIPDDHDPKEKITGPLKSENEKYILACKKGGNADIYIITDKGTQKSIVIRPRPIFKTDFDSTSTPENVRAGGIEIPCIGPLTKQIFISGGVLQGPSETPEYLCFEITEFIDGVNVLDLFLGYHSALKKYDSEMKECANDEKMHNEIKAKFEETKEKYFYALSIFIPQALEFTQFTLKMAAVYLDTKPGNFIFNDKPENFNSRTEVLVSDGKSFMSLKTTLAENVHKTRDMWYVTPGYFTSESYKREQGMNYYNPKRLVVEETVITIITVCTFLDDLTNITMVKSGDIFKVIQKLLEPTSGVPLPPNLQGNTGKKIREILSHVFEYMTDLTGKISLHDVISKVRGILMKPTVQIEETEENATKKGDEVKEAKTIVEEEVKDGKLEEPDELQPRRQL